MSPHTTDILQRSSEGILEMKKCIFVYRDLFYYDDFRASIPKWFEGSVGGSYMAPLGLRYDRT